MRNGIIRLTYCDGAAHPLKKSHGTRAVPGGIRSAAISRTDSSIVDEGSLQNGEEMILGWLVCRFCSAELDSDTRFRSMEINFLRRKIIIYACESCIARFESSTIMRCEYCGNIWLRKDMRGRNGFMATAHCDICRGEADIYRLYGAKGP